MSLKLYYDLMSQPSRALYILLRAANVPFEQRPVKLAAGEHYNDEFKQNVSRFGKVPVLHDGNFKLTESVAIVRYLSREYNLPEKWYPRDSKKQARVDEYLEWQHLNTRYFCSSYFIYKYLLPRMTGSETPPEKIEKTQASMTDCLDNIETLWLSQGKYIAGDELTVADLFAACEIEQPRMAGFEPTEGRPKLKEWLERVRAEIQPHYNEAHVIVNKIAAKSNKTTAKL